MFISKEYKRLNKIMHQAPRGFGGSGHRWSKQVWGIIQRLEIRSMLDYGCGRSTLYKEMIATIPCFGLIDYKEYDPCVPGKMELPMPADLVTCTDVLEHVEPEYLDAVISHLAMLGHIAVYLNINIHEANKQLPDGRNAHLTIQPPMWWKERLRKAFTKDDWLYEELESKRPEKDYFVLLIQRGSL